MVFFVPDHLAPKNKHSRGRLCYKIVNSWTYLAVKIASLPRIRCRNRRRCCFSQNAVVNREQRKFQPV